MKLNKINCDFELLKIASEIDLLGGKIFIVGGTVRDSFLNLKSKDVDCEVFGLKEQIVFDLLEKYGTVKRAGVSFPILITGKYEISICEEKPLAINIFKQGKRRDFTINSIYYDIIEDKIIDNFNGVMDLNKRLIKVNDESCIIEDPLRIIRAAQFAGRFNFEIEENTLIICKKYIKNIDTIAKERIFLELEKILMKCEKPSIVFNILKYLGWLDRVFPEIIKLENIEQGKKFHPEGNAYIHTMLVVDALPINKRKIDIMLTLLLHDIGKGIVNAVPDGDSVHFFKHAEVGADKISEIMSKISENKELTKSVELLTRYHMYPLNFLEGVTTKNVKKIAAVVDVEKLMMVHLADMNGKGKSYYEPDYIKKVLEIYKKIIDEIKPVVSGKDLIKIGIKPNKNMGIILKKLYEMQLNEEFFTVDEGLKIALEFLGDEINGKDNKKK